MKLKAFTIIDVVVALGITSVVFVLASTTYQIALKLYKDYTVRTQTQLDTEFFRTVLQKEIADCSIVKKEGEKEIELSFKTKQPITYRFQENFVIRNKSTHQDTFQIAFDKIAFFYEHYPQKQQNAIIDVVVLSHGKEEAKIDFYFRKKYDAKTLLDYEYN